MSMFHKSSAGRDLISRPVLLLLLTVTIPSVGIVWMMRAAVDNERLAVRQRLENAHRLQLDLAKQHLNDRLTSQLQALDAIALHPMLGEAFQQAVLRKPFNSVIVLDGNGKILYPNSGVHSEYATTDLHKESWQQAERIEFGDQNYREAARLYGLIAEQADNRSEVGRAEQARARCLAQLGETTQAVEVLQKLARTDDAYDPLGRSLAIDAQLALLDHLQPTTPAAQEIRNELRHRLDLYSAPLLPASQRRFAMRRLREIFPTEPEFKTLAAEDLASDVAEDLPPLPSSTHWRATSQSDVWITQTPAKHLVAIAREETLRMLAAMELRDIAKDVRVTILPPDKKTGDINTDNDQRRAPYISLEPFLPGWKLALVENANDVIHSASDRTAFYTWFSVTMLTITLALTALAVGQLRRQNRVSRLKNDLVATISHELKTPLASIRLLVDSLLESLSREPLAALPGNDEGQSTKVREYLELIARENSRLSRLIDNFLTFSRMERGKHGFDLKSTDLAMIARSAADMVQDKFKSAGMPFVVNLDKQAPIRGDADALITAVVNLLENAWKYAGPGKQVTLTVSSRDGRAILCVADDGAGLSAQACRHVFDRFYQVDQRLSRSQGGCGLGLSIVQYIVRAHDGDVTVESELGKGCQFQISLPLDSQQ